MTGERVLFFARVWDPHLFDVVEFYRSDIAAVQGMSVEPVVIEHRLWPALRSPADATFAWWWASALPLVVQARLRGRPVVLTGAINDIGRTSLTGRLRDRFKNAVVVTAMRLATTNILISDYEVATARRLGVRRFEQIYPGVDTQFFAPGPKSGTPTAVTASQLYPLGMCRKGVDVSIAAAGLVRQAVPDFRLAVIGPMFPDGERYLNHLRTTLDFSGVDVLGEVSIEQKRALFSSAWMYLQPSIAEGFGLAMAEAMAAGTVPVCSCHGALPEVVGPAGVVVDNRTPESVAAAILGLIADEVERKRLEAAARQRALDFDSRTRTARLQGILTAAGWPSCTIADRSD